MTATATGSGTVDARTSNWRFVVPAAPPAPVVVGAGGMPAGEVLGGPALPAVVAPDLAGPDDGTGTVHSPVELLAALCARTAPGGWICVGFANRWYARAPFARRSLGLDRVRREMVRNGLVVVATYVALPDHRHPALLVPAQRPAELDHVLRRMLVTYVPPSAPFPRLARRVLSILRAVAVRTPNAVRLRVLPGYFVVAGRPP